MLVLKCFVKTLIILLHFSNQAESLKCVQGNHSHFPTINHEINMLSTEKPCPKNGEYSCHRRDVVLENPDVKSRYRIINKIF